jgi:hypothetical protein
MAHTSEMMLYNKHSQSQADDSDVIPAKSVRPTTLEFPLIIGVSKNFEKKLLCHQSSAGFKILMTK